jgi:O-antigen ligase
MHTQWVNEVVSFTLRIIFFIIPLIFIKNLENFKLTLRTFFWSSWIIAIAAYFVSNGLISLPFIRIQENRFGSTEIIRSPGILSNYADIAIYFGVATLVIVLGFLFERKNYLSLVIYGISFFLFGIALLFTQSRNVVVAILLVFLIVLFLPIPKKYIRNFIQFSILLIGVFFLVLINIYFSALDDLWNEFISLGPGRFTQYQLAWQHFLERPFIGYGLGSFTNMTDYPFEVHNFILQTLHSGGIIGLFLLIGLIIIPLTRMIKLFFLHRVTIQYRYFALYFGMLIILLWTGSFYPAISAIVFWFSIGTLTAIPYIQEFSSIRQNSKTI